MSKQALLLIHGMGSFKPPGKDDQGKPKLGEFGEEFIQATNGALQQYKKHKTDTIEKHIDIHEFNYDTWFDKMRVEMAKNAKSMQERLGVVAGAYGVTFGTDLVGRLMDFEADFNKNEFFYSHWLDVIFYATILGAKVRVDAGIKIAELVETYGAGKVHIMAHSLGTAVLHDTLHLLYRPEFDPNDDIPDLHPINHKLGSIWMVANLSRLVNAVVQLADPLKSVVKPGDEGCTDAIYNVRHELDPFTWLSRFDPQNNGAWVPEQTYKRGYKSIVTNLVVEANTHCFAQYLSDPSVAEHFLYQMTPFEVTLDEMNKVADASAEKTIQGAYGTLEAAFHKLEIKEMASWRDFLDAAEALIDAGERIKNGLQ